MKNLFNLIENHFKFIAVFVLALIVIAFFDKALVLGLILLFVLTTITFSVLSKFGLGSKKLFLLLIIAIIINLGAVLFINYFDFQPFSGGSGGYNNVHLIATELSNNFKVGNFSFEGVPYYEDGKYPYRHYSVIIGLIYTLLIPEMIIGQIFQVWLGMLSILTVYLIVRAIGGSKKWAFLVGLLTSLYPSYLFYGSLLLKDVLVTLLSLLGLLLTIKLIKKFSWRQFLFFYISIIFLFHFRFYIGYILLFTFIVSWLLLARLETIRKKIVYGLIIIFLLGFTPKIALNQNYYGLDNLKEYLNSKTITFYQEKAYLPAVTTIIDKPDEPDELDNSNLSSLSIGFTSTWARDDTNFKEEPLKAFGSYLKYFSYALLGPFPNQLKINYQFLALVETIPWYILSFFIIRGFWRSVKLRNVLILPLIIFSFLVILMMTIFINNFGIITRIRIPALISLLCLMTYVKSNVNNWYQTRSNQSL